MEWPKITKDTPIEEIMRIHRMIWDYVLVNDIKPSTPYLNDCVFCEYSRVMGRKIESPDLIGCICPGDWGYDGWCIPSTYGKWMFAYDEAERKRLAQQIRDIKLKEEYQNGRSEDPIRSGELPE